jgi:hypothetical protein
MITLHALPTRAAIGQFNGLSDEQIAFARMRPDTSWRWWMW